MSSDETHYYAKRTRLIAIIGLSLLFVVLGLWVLGDDDFREGSPLKWAIGGYGGFAMGVAGTVAGLVMLVRPRPAFSISSFGIRFGGLRPGKWIAWHEVDDAQIITLQGQRMLGFRLRDQDQWLLHQPLMRSWILKANIGICGYPLTVAESMLPIPLEALLDDITKRWAEAIIDEAA